MREPVVFVTGMVNLTPAIAHVLQFVAGGAVRHNER